MNNEDAAMWACISALKPELFVGTMYERFFYKCVVQEKPYIVKIVGSGKTVYEAARVFYHKVCTYNVDELKSV